MTLNKLIGLILVCVSFTGSAQDSAELLKGRLSELQTFEASFSQVVTDHLGEILQEADGQMAMLQPDKLRWEVAEPNENLLIADGNTLWHIDPFVEQVVALSQNQAINNNPLILLTDPDNAQWQQYQVTEIKQDDKALYNVESLDAENQYASLVLVFDGSTLVKLDLTDRQGQVSQIRFADIQQNHAISQSKFAFELPEGFDIDDQRAQ